MSEGQRKQWWRLRPRELRLLLYLLLLGALVAWKFLPRPWDPAITVQSAHYTIYSTASREQTETTLQMMEYLYSAWSNQFHALPSFTSEHPRLKVKLFRERALELVRRGGGIDAFQELIGPVNKMQREWHDYVQQLKAQAGRAPANIGHRTFLWRFQCSGVG